MSDSVQARSLLAGAARTIINPPLGIKTVGFSSREGVVEAIESDLTATAVVFSDGRTKVALLALDLCHPSIPTVANWRERIAAAIGTTPAHVLVNLSHTHSGPALPGRSPEFCFQDELIQQNYDAMVPRIVDAARQADAALQPARLAHADGESGIGINRREEGADGYVFLGEAPDKPIDPAVGVVRVDDLAGQPIATLFSYGCHTVVVGPNSPVASPDFPGAARDVLEHTLGGLSLFLQGGGGDIMPVGGMGWEADCRDAKTRVGTALAAEVLKVAADVRTHVRKGERTWLPSLLGPGMTLTPWVAVEGHPATYLDAVSQTITLDLLPFPSLAEAHALREERLRDLAAAEASGQERQLQVARHFVAWADRLVEAIERGDPATVPFEVQAMRVNDVVFVGLSAEVFSATTVDIRRRSPLSHTVALGYTNGVLCYLPRAEDYPATGWRVQERYRIPDLVFQAYLLPTGLAPDSEQRVVEAALALVERLRQPAAERMEALA